MNSRRLLVAKFKVKFRVLPETYDINPLTWNHMCRQTSTQLTMFTFWLASATHDAKGKYHYVSPNYTFYLSQYSRSRHPLQIVWLNLLFFHNFAYENGLKGMSSVDLRSCNVELVTVPGSVTFAVCLPHFILVSRPKLV